MITYKWLEGDDLLALEPVLEQRGWSSLNGKTCRALCAFDDAGALVGFNVVQLHPLVGPMFVDKSARGTGIAEDLADKTADWMLEMNARGYLVVADNPASVKLCESHGMRKITSPVYLM